MWVLSFAQQMLFLIEKIYLCEITATPPHKDIQKTALGATDSVEWEYQRRCCRISETTAKKTGVEVWAVEQAKTFLLNKFNPCKKQLLFWGMKLKA